MIRTLLSFRIEAWLLERLLYYYAGGMVQDKWVREGRELERERIIKLLEQDICLDWTVRCCDGACSAYQDAINLIKGEQK